MAQRAFVHSITIVSGSITGLELVDIIAADLPDTAVVPGSYTTADITVDAQGRITAAANGTLPASYSDEDAQDAVGGILVDTARIDFTYTDATPSITADLIADSITAGYLHATAGGVLFWRTYGAGAGALSELVLSSVSSNLLQAVDAAAARSYLLLGTASILDSDIDGNLFHNGDDRIATQKATKTYVNGALLSYLSISNNLSELTNPATARTNLGLGTAAVLASDTDTTLATNSDLRIPTQKAVKAYVDASVVGLLDFKGSTNCSANPNYPAALKGDAYLVSAAGKIGGASGVSVDLGDMFIATADNAGGTQASVGTSWTIVEHNLTGALLASNNLSDLTNISTARTNLGVEIGTNVQAFDATLTALAAYNTNGLLTQTAADTFTGRTLTGTSNQIVVTDGNGISGNPTIKLEDDIVVVGSIRVPNSGLKLKDIGGSFYFSIALGETLTANRGLTILTGDADRVLEITGFTSISGTHTGTSSGLNTGDQTISLTGDVTGTGTASFAATIANDSVSDVKLRNSNALSVIGRSANSMGDPGDIVAANDGEVLRRSGTTIGFGQTDLIGINITGGTAADPVFADQLPGYDASATANRKFQVDQLLGLIRSTPGGRLTATTAVPVTVSDVTGTTNLYYTPYEHDMICLWDGTRWVWGTFTEKTLALGTLTNAKNYDVFGFLSAGVLTLEALAWTSDSARATAVTVQDGRLCKSGDKTRLYLGTFRTTATTTTEDSKAKRFLSNAYNRVARPVRRQDTGSWTYNSGTYRQANANTANRIEMVCGVSGILVDLSLSELAVLTGGGSYAAIGEDSTTTPHTDCVIAQAASNATVVSFLRTQPAVGYHAYNWLEKTDTNNTHFGAFGLSGYVMG